MSTTNRDLRHAAIRKTLAQPAGGVPDASAIAEAALGAWQQVAGRLDPVIGTRGVAVLFGRALHLTRKRFAWLVVAWDPADSGAALTHLKACFAARETEDAAQAGCALLATFTELLASLIGESLTERLLGPVWVPANPPTDQEYVTCATR